MANDLLKNSTKTFHPYLPAQDATPYVPAKPAWRERMLVDGQLSPGTVGGHHLYALRRSVLAPHLPGWGERNKGIHCIYALHAVAPPAAVDRVTYIWRRHAEQSNRRMYQWRPR